MTTPEGPSPIGWFRRPGFLGHAVPAFEHATVADVMRAGPITCQPETRLRGAAQAMAANHAHALVLLDPAPRRRRAHRVDCGGSVARQSSGTSSANTTASIAPAANASDTGSSERTSSTRT